MTSHATQPPPFWPSRRLWLKLLLASICAPSLVVGAFLVLVAAFSGGGAVKLLGYEIRGALIGILGLVSVIGAPMIMGAFLSSNRYYGAGGGLLVVVVVSVIAPLLDGMISIASRSGAVVSVALIVGSQITILELITGDVRGSRAVVGLGGVLVGLGLSLAFISVFGAINLLFQGNNRVIFPMSALSSVIWLSSVFFPELLTRRVGWGGVIVWAGLVGLVFGVSFVLMK